jgi:hypothetical protein
MRLGMDDDLLVQFALCYQDKSFAEGFTIAPRIGILTEDDLYRDIERVKDKNEEYRNGYFLGICFKNKASRLHKIGMRKLKGIQKGIPNYGVPKNRQ